MIARLGFMRELALTLHGTQGKLDTAMLPRDELRRLFALRKTSSDTHDGVSCKRCPPKVSPAEDGAGDAAPAEAAPGARMAHGSCLLAALVSPWLASLTSRHSTCVLNHPAMAPVKAARIPGFNAPRKTASPAEPGTPFPNQTNPFLLPFPSLTCLLWGHIPCAPTCIQLTATLRLHRAASVPVAKAAVDGTPTMPDVTTNAPETLS